MDIPQLEYPLVMLLISPLILAGLYAIRKGVSKWIIISRIIILSLLIIALASPYSIGISTVRDDAPRITVISDQTLSMDLFNKDLASNLFKALQPKTPTKFTEFAGVKSPIGDEVINAAENNNLVLVTDGNANYGKDLFSAISVVSQAGTRVFAVRLNPLHNDASVEIEGAKNIIIGNENVFNVVVRQAGTDISYRLDVEIDGTSVMSESFTQNEHNEKVTEYCERCLVIPVSYTFTTLGSHRMTATITPSTEDRFNLNNVFYKSVFVVPKPKVLAVTGDTSSPLYTVAQTLYAVTAMTSLPSDLTPYKTVIIDNKGASELPADILRNYVGNGGGLVVVGGDLSYDKGSYNNSPVEAILPIISRAGEFKGGQNVVLVLDASGSTAMAMSQGLVGTPASGNEEIMAIAQNIVLKSKQDVSIGVVAFGASATATIPITKMTSANKQTMIDKIAFAPGSENVGTNLDMGLSSAFDMLKSITGSKEVIVISDGQIDAIYGQSLSVGIELKNAGINFNFIQVNANIPADTNAKYQDLATNLNAELVLTPTLIRPILKSIDESSTSQPTPAPTPEITYEYPLKILDDSHFITQYVNITASVTGYNDVTPKLGSDELVATNGYKPILTTWNFGLGRVVSFTTDNGAGETLWAPEVYSGSNTQLISAMINWAIGDPRPTGGVVIQADDIWAGTAGRVIVTSDTLPQVQLDKAPLDLSRTGPTTYETTINLESGDFHDLSGYGIAVNYPLEYREIGFNDKLVQAIESNGGSVYNENEVQGLLFLDIKEKAVRIVNEPQSEKEPFLLAALVLFLAEVIIRRMKDYRKDRPVIEETPPRTAQVAE